MFISLMNFYDFEKLLPTDTFINIMDDMNGEPRRIENEIKIVINMMRCLLHLRIFT